MLCKSDGDLCKNHIFTENMMFMLVVVYKNYFFNRLEKKSLFSDHNN